MLLHSAPFRIHELIIPINSHPLLIQSKYSALLSSETSIIRTQACRSKPTNSCGILEGIRICKFLLKPKDETASF